MSKPAVSGLPPSGDSQLSRVGAIQENLTRRLQADRSLESLSEAVLEITARTVQKLVVGRVRIGAWGAAIVLLTMNAAASSLITMLWFAALRDQSYLEILSTLRVFTGKSSLTLYAFHVWVSTAAVCQLMAGRFYARAIRRTFTQSTIPAMQRVSDLQEFRKILVSVFDKRRQIKVCAVFATVMSSSTHLILWWTHPEFLTPGTTFLFYLGWLEGCLGWYFVLPALTVPYKLSRFQLTMFTPSPTSSRVIQDLTGLLYKGLLVSALNATLFTSGAVVFGKQELWSPVMIFFLVGAWIPIVSVFGFYHYCLAQMIDSAKGTFLGEIQQHIENARDEMSRQPETKVDRLNGLWDFHEKVRGRNNLAIDIKGILTLLLTLIIPLISALVGFFRGK